jgi:hypothetical protein
LRAGAARSRICYQIETPAGVDYGLETPIVYSNDKVGNEHRHV